MRDAAYRVAEGSGIPQAEESLRAANKAYTRYNDLYNNKYINPLRDPGDRDYIKFYDDLVNKQDYFREVEKTIGHTEEGANVLRQAKRDLVDKKLKSFMDKPETIRSPEYRKTIKELSDTIPKEQMKIIENNMEELVPGRFKRKAKVVQKPKPPEIQKMDVDKLVSKSDANIKAMAKYSKLKTEKVRELLNSRTGIRQLKRDLSGTKRGKEIFKKNAEMKAGEICRGGNVKENYTGDMLKKRINKANNYELIEELTSPEEAEEALKIAERLGDKKVSKENIVALGKKYLGFKALRFLLRF